MESKTWTEQEIRKLIQEERRKYLCILEREEFVKKIADAKILLLLNGITNIDQARKGEKENKL